MKESTMQKWFGTTGEGTIRRAQAWAAQPLIRKLLKSALHFGIGYCLANGVILRDSAPFGVAYVAASGLGLAGASSFAGVLAGYLTMLGTPNGLAYMAASILTFITALVFANTTLSQRELFMPFVGTLSMAAINFALVVSNVEGIEATVLFLSELVLIFGAAMFYRIVLQNGLTIKEDDRQSTMLRHAISYVILISTVLISLSNLSLFGMLSAGRTMALLTVIFMASRGGIGAGAAGGVSIGLSMDLAWGMPYFSMAYGVSGMLAGAFKENGKLWSVSVFVVSHAVSTLWLTNNIVRGGVLFEAFAASVLFMLIPDATLSKLKRKLLTRAGVTVAPTVATATRQPLDRVQKQTTLILSQTANAFIELHKALEAAWTSSTSVDIVSDEAKIIDRVAKRVCDKCALKRICWEKEFERTCEALQQAASALRKQRKVTHGDFAGWFQHRCMSFQAFCETINEESIALFYRRRFNSRIRESRGLVCHQYAETARLLNAMTERIAQSADRYANAEDRVCEILESRHAKATASVSRIDNRVLVEVEGYDLRALYNDRRVLTEELSTALEVPLNQPERQGSGKREKLIFSECEPFRMQVGSAAKQKEGEEVSGDSGVYFKLPDGRLIVILSDGMGSGSKAAAESSWVIRLLEMFIRVGIAPDTALRTINSALMVKGDAEGVFVTVDLLIINLINGECTFYKFGAAPSYVRRGTRVHRITCTALPAGITVDNGPTIGCGRSLDVTQFTLTPDSVVIVASDGIADPTNDEWLQDLLLKSETKDCKTIAADILQTAKIQNGGRDDMSVLVLRMARR
ncbi:MAG: SpoIIE family protein phosphatase [Oscillospiraceae bacterium]|nr:SpoIIE family protein phosphatase [Oscillospiraceae bacterium]